MANSQGPGNLAAWIAEAEQFESSEIPAALDAILKKRIRNRTHPKEWARRTREKVIAALGGCCWSCGATNNLAFDHEGGTRSWIMRDFSQWQRISRIIKEIKAGIKIRLLCRSCNCKDAQLRKYTGKTLPSSPLYTPNTITLTL